MILRMKRSVSTQNLRDDQCGSNVVENIIVCEVFFGSLSKACHLSSHFVVRQRGIGASEIRGKWNTKSKLDRYLLL